jgi:hypothetical protein
VKHHEHCINCTNFSLEECFGWELMQQNALIENKDLLQSTPLLTQRLL